MRSFTPALLRNSLAALAALSIFFHSVGLEAGRPVEKDTLATAVDLVNSMETIGSLVSLAEALANDSSGILRKSLFEEGVDLAAPPARITFRGASLALDGLDQTITVHDKTGMPEISIASQRWRYGPKQDLHWNFSKLRGMWEPFWRFKKKGPMSNVALEMLAWAIPDARAAGKMSPAETREMLAGMLVVATASLAAGKLAKPAAAGTSRGDAPAAPASAK